MKQIVYGQDYLEQISWNLCKLLMIKLPHFERLNIDALIRIPYFRIIIMYNVYNI